MEHMTQYNASEHMQSAILSQSGNHRQPTNIWDEIYMDKHMGNHMGKRLSRKCDLWSSLCPGTSCFRNVSPEHLQNIQSLCCHLALGNCCRLPSGCQEVYRQHLARMEGDSKVPGREHALPVFPFLWCLLSLPPPFNFLTAGLSHHGSWGRASSSSFFETLKHCTWYPEQHLFLSFFFSLSLPI